MSGSTLLIIRRFSPFLLILVFLFVFSRPARAAVITVDSASDGTLAALSGNGTCDLREAIEAANTDNPVDACPAGSGADTIDFTGSFTISLVEQLVISSDVTIDAANNIVTIDGGNNYRLFAVESQVLILETTGTGLFTLQNGSSITPQDVNGIPRDEGGCIFVANLAALTLNAVTVQDCTATNGGGVYGEGAVVFMLNSAEIILSTANISGGGMYLLESTLNATSAVFTGNQAFGGFGGGGIALVDSTGTIDQSVISSNSAFNSSGGGVTVKGGTLDITSTSIFTNETDFTGGGVFAQFGGITPTSTVALTISGSNIYTNTARGFGGGGIGVDGAGLASVDITTTQVYQNTAENLTLTGFGHGGGINLAGVPSATITSSNIYLNTADEDGGGVWLSDVPLTLVSVSIRENQADSNTDADGDGGGIWLQNNSTLTLNAGLAGAAADIAYNTAYSGAGVYINQTSTMNVSPFGTTPGAYLVGNIAAAQGGGIYIETGGTMNANSARLFGNIAPAGGAVFGEASLSSSTRQCTNCCIVGNSDVAVQASSGASDLDFRSNWWGSDFGPYIPSAPTNTASGTSNGDSISSNGTAGSGVFIGTVSIPADYGSSSTGGNIIWLRSADGNVPLDCELDQCGPVSSIGHARTCDFSYSFP